MKKYRVWAVILPFCLTTALAACVTTEKVPGTSANASNAQMENASQQNEDMQQPEVAAKAQTAAKEESVSPVVEPPPPPADPCAATLAQLADQARSGMKTVIGSCQDQKIEVNPMWAKDYSGAVRVRIYDAAGKLKSMETIKP